MRGIMRRNGMDNLKTENMEVFKILSVLDSNQHILSEVEYLHFGLLKDVAVILWHFGSC